MRVGLILEILGILMAIPQIIDTFVGLKNASEWMNRIGMNAREYAEDNLTWGRGRGVYHVSLKPPWQLKWPISDLALVIYRDALEIKLFISTVMDFSRHLFTTLRATFHFVSFFLCKQRG